MKTDIKSETNAMTIYYYVNNILPNLTVDKSFQASTESRWKEGQKSAYVTSVMRGMIPTPFVLCDVGSCLEAMKQKEYVSDIEYYEKWVNKGIHYLNVDSNNRTIIIQDFIDNKISIESGRYKINGEFYKIESDKNDTYDNLPDKMREHFNNQKMLVVFYKNATRSELSELFININDGSPLNSAEKRNALTSDIASTIRNLAEKYKHRFDGEGKKWFSEKQVIRRQIDDFIAGCCSYYFSNDITIANSTPTKLWDMYQIGSDADKSHVSFRRIFNKFMEFFDDDLNAIANRNSIFDLFVLFVQLKNENKRIDKDKKEDFIKHYINVIADLIKQNKFYEFDGPDSMRGYRESKPFDTLVAGRSASNNYMRNKLLREKLNLDEYTIQLDKRRSVTANEKLIAACENGGVTNDGSDIDLSRLHTDDYHGGHRKAWIKGGKTNLDNIVIQKRENNLKNGISEIK